MSQPINLDEVLQLQASTVARWHDEDIDNPYTGLFKIPSALSTVLTFSFGTKKISLAAPTSAMPRLLG